MTRKIFFLSLFLSSSICFFNKQKSIERIFYNSFSLHCVMAFEKFDYCYECPAQINSFQAYDGS